MGDETSSAEDETGTSGDETEKERVDRELIEFLNEVRVVLPGVQVLFAFLLTLPFTGTFSDINGAERFAYNVAFFATALAAVLMITPTSFHRLRFRKGDKEEILRTSNRLILAGILCLGVAIVAVVWLVSELVFTPSIAIVICIVSALIVVTLWFALPLSRRFVEGR
jgi:phosphatidylserine synthase